MAATLPCAPRVSPADRLGLTLFIAIAVHLLVILGIGFELDLFKPREQPLSLEIILVHSKSEEAPEQADYLAQVSQRGGGELQERQRARSPESSQHAHSEQGDAPEERPMSAPPPSPAHTQREVMSAELARPAQLEQRPTTPTTLPAPTTAELMQRSREIARLSAEIQQRQQAYAQMERSRTISANTRESIYAAYQSAWQEKVERIGNLNYPDDARRQGLSGSLLLLVSIRADGSLAGVEVLRSSGHRALDEGAVRIVRMAAPYAPFSEALRKEVDVLHITRVWDFSAGARLGVMQ
ncbi:MAG: energy transducer TonB [Thiohalomonadaceae bacterium]